MTATYGEVGLSYGAINWGYDGNELNLGPYDPTVFLDADGRLLGYVSLGRLQAFSARGPLAAFSRVGVYAPVMAASGRNRTYAASGGLRSYTATGVIEDGD